VLQHFRKQVQYFDKNVEIVINVELGPLER
jgi:hypothetical protein